MAFNRLGLLFLERASEVQFKVGEMWILGEGLNG